ncbi:MAG: LPXTG-motif cell wall anchor domain protein, partial [Blastococcus sp.]|nr:LPXTG-motif cell wall anchor domain protein [Blastococcus sp.]
MLLCAAVGVLVGALGIPHAAADDAVGLLRIAHLSPDTPAVDVALSPLHAGDGAPLTDPGPDVATGLGYGDVSAFADVRPGSYAVSLRAAGTGHGTPPVLTARVDVPAGEARTVAVTGLFADLGLESLPDDLSAPPAGSARVRVLSAASGIRSVDVGLEGGPALATALPFGGAGSPVVVPPGPTIVWVDGAPGSATALPVTWTPGSITTLLVLDAPGGGLTVRLVLDAAGPAVVPTGAVEAGGGGGAGLPAALPWTLATAIALAAVSRRGRVLAVVATAVLVAAP